MAEDFDISGYTLFERQSMFYNASKCVYCLGDTDLVDSIEVYQKSHGLIYICRKCSAWCGVHRGGDQSLGTVAKKPLRTIRHECHKFLDPLWQAKVRKDNVSVKRARAAAYNWISTFLGIEKECSHIGYMNIAQCEKILEECKKCYETPEKIALKESWIKWNKDVVYFNAEEFGYDVKEFQMNGFIQLELSHKSGKVLKYNPKDRTGAWSGKKSKWNPIEDIDHFIKLNFQ